MHIKSIVRELREMRDGIGGMAGRKLKRRHVHRQGRSHIAPETTVTMPWCAEAVEQGPWANLPPELLLHLIKRIEASQIFWPSRKDIVACASICKSWREVTKEAVNTPEQCGRLTFPISLKQANSFCSSCVLFFICVCWLIHLCFSLCLVSVTDLKLT